MTLDEATTGFVVLGEATGDIESGAERLCLFLQYLPEILDQVFADRLNINPEPKLF